MSEKKKICVIHGPNLNLLGSREPVFYGKLSLEQINELIQRKSEQLGLVTQTFQSNLEGEIVSKIQEISEKNFNGLIINPAAYTHTSIAIRDAISGTKIQTIEVHLSNLYQRESFRQKSLIAEVSLGQISGFAHISYLLALEVFALRGK